VQAGANVTAQPALVVGSGGLAEFGADWPSWHKSGSKLGFVLGMGDLRQISAQPGPLEVGDLLFASGVSPMQFADYLAWSPLPTNEFLYRGWDVSGDETIYLGVEGGSDAGQPLVIIPASDRVEGLAWLPDGSGLVFLSNREGDRNVWFIRPDGSGLQQLTRQGGVVGELALLPR